MMNILLIGSGGREHALAYKLSESPSVRLFAAPGNPGIAQHAQLVALDVDNHADVVAWCANHAIELVVIGPEAPLAAGLADDLRAAHVPVFGPSKAAAQLESSKGFAKEFMRRHGIPTAQFLRFSASQLEQAREYVRFQTLPIVIKADGLAAGKGVVIAETREQALSAVEEMLGGKFGAASAAIVIEQFLRGEEASVFAISDGERFLTLAPAQDHKRIGEGDTGENTGGMGAYCPAPVVTDAVLHTTREHIIEPTLRGMKQEGMPFVGCLYVGLMIVQGEPFVVEFNARFGDPETQVLMSVLDADLPDLLLSAAVGALRPEAVRSVCNGAACCVVLAAEGYPGVYRKGDLITGVEQQYEHVRVFHAGTTLRADNRLATNGGRVLGVTGCGESLEAAIAASYKAAEAIHFDGKTYRRDIGAKALLRAGE
jgi:phosphoribosylamine--glycine ligase